MSGWWVGDVPSEHYVGGLFVLDDHEIICVVWPKKEDSAATLRARAQLIADTHVTISERDKLAARVHDQREEIEQLQERIRAQAATISDLKAVLVKARDALKLLGL